MIDKHTNKYTLFTLLEAKILMTRKNGKLLQGDKDVFRVSRNGSIITAQRLESKQRSTGNRFGWKKRRDVKYALITWDRERERDGLMDRQADEQKEKYADRH